MPGVINAKLVFTTGKLKVEHEPNLSLQPFIIKTIASLGYNAIAEEENYSQRDGISRHKESLYWKSNPFIVSTILSGTLLLLALLVGLMDVNVYISPTIYVLGILLGGYLPARNGWTVLKTTHELDMNALMTIAALGAIAIGQWEEGTVVVFLFSLGNALQGISMEKTRHSIRSLMELRPEQALVLRNGKELVLVVKEILMGDRVIIRPGERIAMDGRVVAGSSSVDQATLTGESIPVFKQMGDVVYAGTMNQRGSLEISVTKLAENNTISQIIKMVEEAQSQKAPSQLMVDRFARIYTPAVMIGALGVAIIPTLFFNQPFAKWVYEALAMLLVACPCALVISTPVAIVSAIGSAAKQGVLIKGGVALEQAGTLSVIAFDKTGTLTRGKPQLSDIITTGNFSELELLGIAASIESRSEHPLGEAIVKHSQERNVPILELSHFESLPGMGALGLVEKKMFYIGNQRLMSERNYDFLAVEPDMIRLQEMGKTVMLIADETRILGLIAVQDVLREDSAKALKQLKRAGIEKLFMLTGDHEGPAKAMADEAGVDEYKANLLPEDKLSVIKELLVRYKNVGMVGDGVNDAPALALSTVGFAMGAAGNDSALETADIALMGDDLSRLAYTIDLSRRTRRIIKQNIGLSLLIKASILLLVIPGWLTLWLAVIGDMGTSLLVTINGLRLLRNKAYSLNRRE